MSSRCFTIIKKNIYYVRIRVLKFSHSSVMVVMLLVLKFRENYFYFFHKWIHKMNSSSINPIYFGVNCSFMEILFLKIFFFHKRISNKGTVPKNIFEHFSRLRARCTFISFHKRSNDSTDKLLAVQIGDL